MSDGTAVHMSIQLKLCAIGQWCVCVCVCVCVFLWLWVFGTEIISCVLMCDHFSFMTHTQTHTRSTHARTHARTHAHTHTHTQAYPHRDRSLFGQDVTHSVLM